MLLLNVLQVKSWSLRQHRAFLIVAMPLPSAVLKTRPTPWQSSTKLCVKAIAPPAMPPQAILLPKDTAMYSGPSTLPTTPMVLVLVFSHLRGLTISPQYMGYAVLGDYSPKDCADECNKRAFDENGGLCQYFNIWQSSVPGTADRYICSMVVVLSLLSTIPKLFTVLLLHRRVDSHQQRSRQSHSLRFSRIPPSLCCLRRKLPEFPLLE